MAQARYPKSFYDDGLGDILEFIDDEILVHSDREKLVKRKKHSGARTASKGEKTSREAAKNTKHGLYGENDVSELQQVGSTKSKKVKLANVILEPEKVDSKLGARVRGLINRLAAQTLPFVTAEFEKLYSINSRSAINTAIFDNIETSILNKHAISKRKLTAEFMLLVSYLSSKVHQDIGASLVHWLVKKLENMYTDTQISDEDKRLDNIIYCLANLYTVGLISAHVIFELTKRICSDDFKPKSVELLLLLLKSVGFQLRKDNPSLMRQLIVMAQDRCNTLKSNEQELSMRIQFMTEALSAIKNNNMSKISNYGCDIDRDTIESSLKSLIQRTRLAECLSDASYQEILNSPNWYLLESRVDEQDESSTDARETVKAGCSSNDCKIDVKICKALGLNKPAERTIFAALLRASDYPEASNIIIGYGMNHCSDAILVCLQVAIHEKKYNEFYYNLINNLCKFNRKYKMAATFAIRDKIRTLSQLKTGRVDIFKRLCFELVRSDAVPITILKAIEWADLNNSTKEFLTYMFESTASLPEDDKRRIMSKVERKSSFVGAMRTFVNCFMKDIELFR